MSTYNDENSEKPNAYRVEDDDNLKEESLKKTFLGGEMKDADQPGMESHGAGGEKFGEENLTTAGDDKNNPSQHAGYTNGYFARTEPSDENPQNNNFKDGDQQGEPDYTSKNGDEGGND
ncbi:MAG: hypothetical protein ABIN95_00295 [Mucilaginibacter sp.]